MQSEEEQRSTASWRATVYRRTPTTSLRHRQSVRPGCLLQRWPAKPSHALLSHRRWSLSGNDLGTPACGPRRGIRRLHQCACHLHAHGYTLLHRNISASHLTEKGVVLVRHPAEQATKLRIERSSGCSVTMHTSSRCHPRKAQSAIYLVPPVLLSQCSPFSLFTRFAPSQCSPPCLSKASRSLREE